MGEMMGGTGLGFGFALIGLFINLIIIVGVVMLGFWAIRQFRTGGQGSNSANNRSSEETPREIVEKRYARGEITREEYQEILSDLN